MGCVVVASTWGNLPSLLERLAESPIMSALIDELEALATEVNENTPEEAAGDSWAVLVEEDRGEQKGPYWLKGG